METRRANAPAPTARDMRSPLARIALLYALLAGLWILLSDRVVDLLFDDADLVLAANTLKGLLFVAVTTGLLFFLSRRYGEHFDDLTDTTKLGAGDTATAPARRILQVGIALLSLVFLALGVGGVMRSWEGYRDTASAHLQSIARLKTSHLETWLEERMGDIQVARGSPLFNELLPRWRKNPDSDARARLLARMEALRVAYRYRAVLICDARGENILLRTGDEAQDMSAPLGDAVRRAVANGVTVRTDIYPMAVPAHEHAHLDFVAPLDGGAGKEGATAAIVLRADVDGSIYPDLQTWPVPSTSAEALLVRRDGDDVLFLNELRHGKETALKLRIPMARREVLAAQALAPGYTPGTLLEGVDYRGTPSLGVARPVAGTDWWLIAKIDRSEIFRQARREAVWIAFAGLLIWIATAALAIMAFQRHELRHAQHESRAQAEKLRALRLLDAIIGGSADAIFAKDTEGRYLLFNNEAARVTGKTAAEVLGKDDRVLFPPEQAERIMTNDRAVMDNKKIETFQEKLETTDGEIVFLATKGPLLDADGRVFGLFGISRDITPIKQAETALRRQAEELAARNAELERFNRLMVGRELDMIALKREINGLSREFGRPPPYSLDFAANSPEDSPS